MIEVKFVANAELPPIGDKLQRSDSKIVLGYGREAIQKSYSSNPIEKLDRQIIVFTQDHGIDPKAYFSERDNRLYVGYDNKFVLVNPANGSVLAQLDGTIFMTLFSQFTDSK